VDETIKYMKNYYKIFFICSLLFIFSYPLYALESGIEKISPVISNSLTNLNINTIAVINFINLKGKPTELGRFVAEELSVALADSSNKFNIIDRTYMDALLKKNGIEVSDFINPSTALTVAKISGIKTILTGTVLPLNNRVEVFAKIISTKTGKILATFDFNLEKDSTIDALLTQSSTTNRQASSEKNGIKPALQIQESHNFFFAITKCKLSNSSLVCNLTITNQSNPNNIFILLSAQAIDPYGVVYPVSEATMNGITFSSDGTGNFGSMATNSNLFSVAANQGVPIKTQLVFNSVSFNIKKISLLELTFATKQQQNMGNLIVTTQENPYPVKFDNVSLTNSEE
jgi:TolB-like protein